MWEDKVLYWIWRSKIAPTDEHMAPPTKKRVEYATIIGPGKYLNGPDKGKMSITRQAVGVWDDDKYTPLNRGDGLCEIEWHRKYGSKIVMPPEEI